MGAASSAISLVGSAFTAIGTALGMDKANKPPKAQAPPKQADPNVAKQQATTEAAQESVDDQRKRATMGRRSTFRTGPLGLTNSVPMLSKKTLLGE